MQVKNTLAYSIGNSLIPQEGPLALALNLNFAGIADGFQIDQLNLPSLAQKISMVQTVYIDTSQTDASVVFSVGKSGQVIIAKGRTQGYYPVVAPNSWTFDVQCGDAFGKVGLVLCNYQVAPGVWPAVKP